MKLTPKRGNKVATIGDWVKGKFLTHRSLLKILVPLAALIAVLVWYFPLWQLSFNPSRQVDDGGPRGFYPTTEEMQAGADILRASGYPGWARIIYGAMRVYAFLKGNS